MDFNEYSKNNPKNRNRQSANKYGLDDNIVNLVSALANKYDGKSQTELIKAIYEQAKKGKENGTLSNGDIDNFVSMLSPMLDEKKRNMLFKIAQELKKI